MISHPYYPLANPIITNPTFDENISVVETSGDSTTVQTITVFDNVDPTEIVQPMSITRSLIPMEDSSQGISNFLSRPVLLDTINWTATTSTVSYISPWTELIANPQYNKKLINFNGLRADVRLRFVLNGTPFHYGRAIAWYLPMTSRDDGSKLTRDSYLNRIINHVTGGGVYGIQHVVLDPTLSTPCEMLIPYESSFDYIPFNGASTVLSSSKNLGVVGVSVDTALLSASQAVPEPITIQVYGWFENVVLIMPTPYESVSAQQLPALERVSIEDFDIEVQGGEATSKGPITRVASAIAATASVLKQIPFIKPFAMATEIGANAVSGIATIFGFSLPVTVDRYEVVKQHMASNWTYLSGRDTSVKVTLDPLQEVTVDPIAMGLSDPRDQMSYAYLMKIPTLLGRYTWAVGTAEGTTLCTHNVTPARTPCSPSNTFPTTFYPSPLNALAHGHRYWVGTLKYRIEVICSAYHKGRIQVRYIPNGLGTLLSTPIPGFGLPNAQTFIMDLSVDHKKEFTIGWCQEVPNRVSAPMISSTDAGAPMNASLCNGLFTVEILTKLTAPATVAPVKVLIFMEGTDQLRFIEPTNIYYSQVQIQGGQSEVVSTGGDLVSVHFGGPYNLPSNYSQVIHGEQCVSLRSLLKRFVPVGRFGNSTTGANVLKEQLLEARVYLDPYVGTTGTPYYATQYSTYTDFWRLSYLGSKGGRRYKLLWTPGSTLANALDPKRCMIYRAPFTDPASNAYPISFSDVSQRCGVGNFLFNSTNEVVEFEIPDYSRRRYRLNNAISTQDTYTATYGIGVAAATLCTYNASLAGQVVVEVMSALSDDASLLRFVACPPLYAPAAFTASLTVV